MQTVLPCCLDFRYELGGVVALSGLFFFAFHNVRQPVALWHTWDASAGWLSTDVMVLYVQNLQFELSVI